MNQENYATKASVLTEDARPDFGRIMDALQKEAAFSSELSNRLASITNGIKTMSNPDELNDVKEKEPCCLVDYLWVEIWRLQKSHRLFERTIAHLQKTIGS